MLTNISWPFSYYKNVRKEWASLVSTPTTAKFQDALAFTRSLGDLHLHTYGTISFFDSVRDPCVKSPLYFPVGVTHLPEVHRIDLAPIFQALHAQPPISSLTSGANSGSSATSDTSGSLNPIDQIANSTICVVIATDGVWDNWIYEDVGRFMMDSSCLNATANHPEGAQKVMTSFMIRNSQFSKKNFGNQADNATGIVLYLSHASSFSA